MMKIITKKAKWFLSSLICSIGLTFFTITPIVFAATLAPQHQFLADVNGDGKADSIIITTYSISSPNGPYQGHEWWVAISNGSKFGAPSRWAHNFGDSYGAVRFFVVDVTGDNKADAVTFDPESGDWYVMPSNGTVFGNGDPNYSPLRWVVGHGVGSTNQLLSDINGDGTADAIVFFGKTGEWWVGPSEGNKFGIVGRWSVGQSFSGHGVGADNQFVADVNGGGKADAMVFFASTGQWWVAINIGGAGFGIPERWQSGHGSGSNNQFLRDVTGDGKADAVVFFSQTGNWYVAPSAGTSFDGGSPYFFPPLWMSGHGVGSNNQLLADVTGDSRADSAVFFSGNQGNWYIAPSFGSSFNNGSPYFFPPLWISGHGAGT